ncbi:MAG: hypothetical protein LKF75_03915 [Bacilli bacterium]|jgi:hypothetical protein|nr:hypothetical protein [Bacilli bacterium]
MDDKFESNLKDGLKSSYEIKTSAQDILSKYHEETAKAKPVKSYRVPFYSALGACAALLVAFAIYIPVSHNAPAVESSSEPIGSLSDINVSPLKNQAATFTYEVSSLYPLLKKSQALSSASNLSNAKHVYKENDSDDDDGKNEDIFYKRFEEEVDAYEIMESSVRDAFFSSDENYDVYEGSFVTDNGTYAYRSDLGEMGMLYFNVTFSGEVWKSLSGEIVEDDESTYFLTGANVTTDGYEDLEVILTSSDDEHKVSVSQKKSKGLFYFSYNIFEEGKLTTTFSTALLEEDGITPIVEAKYYLLEDNSGGYFHVKKESETIYGIYGIFVGKISLSYNNGERTYTYGSYVIKED